MCLRLDPCNASGLSVFFFPRLPLFFFPFKAFENHKRALMIHQCCCDAGESRFSVANLSLSAVRRKVGKRFETLYLSRAVTSYHIRLTNFGEIKASSAGLLIPSSAPLPKLGDGARVSCEGLALLRRRAPRQRLKPNVPQ